jgi:hypothetical protein
MLVYAIRLFIFTLLPVLAAAILARYDRFAQSRPARLELFLLYQFGLGVVAGGIGNFLGHVFLADAVAASIGWPAGSPFQTEIGFSSLATGVLGLIAATRRDGFREATVIAIAVSGVGATLVHLADIVQHGNLAPGNTLQNVSNLLKPALLIGFLVASRRADAALGSPTMRAGFAAWQTGHAQLAGWLAGLVATGFGIGYGMERPLLGTGIGLLIAAAVAAVRFRRIQAALPAAPSAAE